LVHGWESNASRWGNLLPYLKKSGSTIIAIDGPAHGLSSGKEFSIPNMQNSLLLSKNSNLSI
jgi:pimeloyl-ACP methyl ester carboxylesterase